MEWAKEETFLWTVIEDVGEVPPALARKPPLPDKLVYAWQAFWRLCGDRPYYDAGRGPISFAAIDGYARRFGIDEIDQFERFLELTRAMDRTFLDWTPPADG